ncbi:hypothetical protein [Gemmata massiliana]|uniref:hypothetical protein n=1 Tax=Gemmata massiliana TaxID=1210884 RepID=UPI0013A7049A|nr:hypothetical protein [Gemmata massiliana]
MAVHWTEYPERVETFGDLSSILATLDNHDMEAGFTADSFRNERGRTTAYTVDFYNKQYRFHPRLDQMPGLERLLDRFNIDGHDTLTLSQFRELRTRVANALKCSRTEVDAMTFIAIEDALDAAERPPKLPVSAQRPFEAGIKTFGDLLLSVQGVEQVVASLRATADSMNNDPGTGHWRLQAGMYESTAEHKDHPAFPFLEAHVNRVYGVFDYANLLRVRGEVCAIRQCGTRDVDQLTVEQVVSVLGCPGAPAVHLPGAPTPRQTDAPADGALATATSAVPEPNQENVAEQSPIVYTVSDVRDLMRYQGELARFEEWRQRTYKPVSSMNEFTNRAHSMALNAPQSGRLTPERAVELSVYRQLVKACRATLHKELDELALLYFVGEVADSHKRNIEAMWPLSLNEFGKLMDGLIGTNGAGVANGQEIKTSEKTSVPATSTSTQNMPANNSETGSPKLARNIGGRPKLGKGPKTTPQQNALRNVYVLIRAKYKPGVGPKALLDLFRNDKDFRTRVAEADETVDRSLFKNAIAWIKDNPDQETQSGNVS